MISNKEFVSRVVNGGRFLSKDAHISWRYVLSIGRTKAKFLLTQKLDELTLSREEGIKTYIECLPMKRITSKDCGIVEFKLCEKLMRSCDKLPEGLFGKVGSGILRVSTIDGENNYDFITPTQYSRKGDRKRMYKRSGSKYFYIKNGYLYLPGSNAHAVDIDMIATDKAEAAKLSTCGGTANQTITGSGCGNWGIDFVCPDRFLDLVVQETINEVANFYRTSVPDENPNLDAHEKTKTTP